MDILEQYEKRMERTMKEVEKIEKHTLYNFVMELGSKVEVLVEENNRIMRRIKRLENEHCWGDKEIERIMRDKSRENKWMNEHKTNQQA